MKIEILDRQMWLVVALKAKAAILAERERRNKEYTEKWKKKSKFSKWFWADSRNYDLDYINIFNGQLLDEAEKLAFALRTKGTGVVQIDPHTLDLLKGWADNVRSS